MRSDVSVTRRNRLVTGRGVVLLLAAGLLAGCSTDALRFDQDGFYNSAVPSAGGVDSMSTGSVSSSPQRVGGPARPNQDLRGSAAVANAPGTYASAAPTTPVYSSQPSAARTPIYDRRQLPPSNSNGGSTLLAPPSRADTISTGSVPTRVVSAPLAPASQSQGSPAETTTSSPTPARTANKAEWNGQGTKVTLGDGETVYSISRRYGVPVEAITKANNLGNASDVRAGQTLVIPRLSFGQSNAAPASNQASSASAATAPSSSSGKDGQYRVVAGDTLAAIARRAGTSVSSLKAANRMSDDTIRVGQVLTLPGRELASAGGASSASVDPIATGPLEAKSNAKTEAAKSEAKAKLPSYEKPKSEEVKTIAKAAEATENAPKATGVSKLRWPAKGRVIRGFGGGNSGIDIAVPMGTPVKAAENGVVVYSGSGLKDLGNTVLIQHDDGTTTVYGNASELSVKKGDKVVRGQQVARAGTTGNASAPQVHFEVRKKSNPVDPAKWLE
ncbi:peptidoglycan DD-metalloendopeptidase family protein [Notoacmeibacter ruber]|nr:peptidoglycan DD-metalloendopeptidase family protein [Notoacmeibacter ruber]